MEPTKEFWKKQLDLQFKYLNEKVLRPFNYSKERAEQLDSAVKQLLYFKSKVDSIASVPWEMIVECTEEASRLFKVPGDRIGVGLSSALKAGVDSGKTLIDNEGNEVSSPVKEAPGWYKFKPVNSPHTRYSYPLSWKLIEVEMARTTGWSCGYFEV